MNPFALKYLLYPHFYLLSYLFCLLTDFNNIFPLTELTHILNIFWACAVLSGYGQLTKDFLSSKKNTNHKKYFWTYIFLGLLITVCVLFTDIAHSTNSNILQKPQLRALVKLYFILPLIIVFFSKKRKVLTHILTAALTFSCIWTCYQIFFNSQIDPITGRPDVYIGGRDTNFFSTILCVHFALVFDSLFKAINTRKKVDTLIYTLVAPIFLGTILLLSSRMAFLATAIVIFSCFFQIFRGDRTSKRTKWTFTLGFTTISFFVFYVTSGNLLERLKSFSGNSSSYRMDAILASINIFKEFPWLGIGMENGSEAFYKYSGYGPFQSLDPKINAHNIFFQVLGELGFVGVCVFSLVLLVPFSRILKHTYNKQNFTSTSSSFLLIGFVALLLNAMTLPLAYSDWMHFYIFLLGFLGANTAYRTQETNRDLENAI